MEEDQPPKKKKRMSKGEYVYNIHCIEKNIIWFLYS